MIAKFGEPTKLPPGLILRLPANSTFNKPTALSNLLATKNPNALKYLQTILAAQHSRIIIGGAFQVILVFPPRL
ncbi:2723_t:CDS:2 [Funneliformis mosseae]|uniref:2723_t:CDS:1 n=1 Tax=Funneliformis mosseae TaxID=27381 RepID=A0A9N9DVQ8_FUNMO|nr:2723_t:CDS:2 [Funneliformis mosseae]